MFHFPNADLGELCPPQRLQGCFFFSGGGWGERGGRIPLSDVSAGSGLRKERRWNDPSDVVPVDSNLC